MRVRSASNINADSVSQLGLPSRTASCYSSGTSLKVVGPAAAPVARRAAQRSTAGCSHRRVTAGRWRARPSIKRCHTTTAPLAAITSSRLSATVHAETTNEATSLLWRAFGRAIFSRNPRNFSYTAGRPAQNAIFLGGFREITCNRRSVSRRCFLM